VPKKGEGNSLVTVSPMPALNLLYCVHILTSNKKTNATNEQKYQDKPRNCMQVTVYEVLGEESRVALRDLV